MGQIDNAERIDIREQDMDNGVCRKLSVNFGPHHFLEIELLDGKTRFRLGATHHGFEADASTVPSQLEALIDEIRRNHPDQTID